MKVLLVLSAVLLGCLAYPPSTEEAYVQWNSFKSNFQRSYGKSEDLQRLNIFVQNLKEIQEHNERFEQGLETYKQGITQFTDLTREEFVDYVNSFKPGKPTRTNAIQYRAPLNVELPETVDWRDKKVVTAVKNQEQCGSCWAFSTTGSLESQNSLINGVLVELSEQELVDCATGKYDNAGCDGGFMESAFDYVRDNGLTTEQAYPYEARDGKCRRSGKAEAIRASGYVEIKARDESDLQSAVATVGPVSVAVDASYWQNYDSGVFTDRNCGNTEDDLNHGVLATGYGTENGKKYWLVKNSWGASWGESGYIKMARDSNNNCGIATDSSYPLL